MKKQVLLLVCLLMTVFSNMAFGQDVVIDGIFYRLGGDEACVIKKSNGYKGDITIPSTVIFNGLSYTVNLITTEAFSGSTGLTSITLPNSIKTIGDKAFSGCI